MSVECVAVSVFQILSRYDGKDKLAADEQALGATQSDLLKCVHNVVIAPASKLPSGHDLPQTMGTLEAALKLPLPLTL